jgi:hypothetical protein
LWKCGDLIRERLRLFEGAARCDEALDQADLQRLHRWDWSACEDQVQRAALADHARKPDRAHVDQRHAKAPVEDAECRVRGGHAKVAPQCQLEPSGHGVALDRSDHRLAEDHPRRAHRTVARVRRAAWILRSKRFQIEARAKVPVRTRQDRDRQGFRLVEFLEGLSQGRRSFRIDGIPDFGPRDGHRHHAALG